MIREDLKVSDVGNPLFQLPESLDGTSPIFRTNPISLPIFAVPEKEAFARIIFGLV